MCGGQPVASPTAVAIGSSSDGFRAVGAILKAIPPGFPGAVFVVQHRSPRHPGYLAELLRTHTSLEVREPTDNEPLRPGVVYIAPADRHLLVEDGRVRVSAAPPVNFSRPSVDVLFDSLANVYGERVYRINVIEIRLPPLRERTGDVRLLVHAFLKRYGLGRVTACDDGAMEALEAYRWPGNVRELQNVIERACALADGAAVTRDDLPDHVVDDNRSPVGGQALTDARLAASSMPLKEAKDQWMGVLEASYLRDLLERHGGNISAAAKDAGIDRKTFHRLVTKHGIR